MWLTNTLTQCLQCNLYATPLGLLFSDACDFLTYHIQDLPYVVRKLLFLTALSRLDILRTVRLEWSCRIIRTPRQIKLLTPEGKRCQHCKYRLPR
jgi:hypothetical protein